MIYLTAAFFILLMLTLLVGGVLLLARCNQKCAWCIEESGLSGPTDANVSHTICPQHKRELLADFAAEEGFEVPITTSKN